MCRPRRHTYHDGALISHSISFARRMAAQHSAVATQRIMLVLNAETSRREFQEIAEPYLVDTGPAYALWGPHEFKGTGPEAYFDISDRLGEISIPALILCGWYDELFPKRCSRTLADGIADNEFVVFGNASHLTILEGEAELSLTCIRDLLKRRVTP
jgi:pimeloyl-ACP methyl ester carboxylesterase